MSTIKHLPVRALRQILAINLPFDVNCLCKWKLMLPYIAVCQSWRQLGLSSVYNRVFFMDYDLFINGHESTRQNRGQHFYRHGLPNNRPVLLSNIELFTDMDRCDMVWDIFIHAKKDGPQNRFFGELLRLLQLTKGDWRKLEHIHLDEQVVSNKLVGYTSADYKDKTYDLGPIIEYAESYFTAIFNINGPDSKTLLGQLTQKLFYLYVDKAFYMRGYMSYFASFFDKLPTNIIHLTLIFDKTKEILNLPVIYVESLKVLVFRRLPPRFNWSCFRNFSIIQGGKVGFQELLMLYISYSTDYMDSSLVCDRPEPWNKLEFKFSFPNLRRLYVSDCTKNNRLLHSEFPKEVDIAAYYGSISSIALSQQIKVKSRILYVDITSADTNEEFTFYDITNGMLAGIDKDAYSSIILSSMRFPINIYLINWDNLKSLTIDIPISYKSLTWLIRNLPLLKRLSILANSIKSIQDTRECGLIDELTIASSLYSCDSLQELQLYGEYDPYRYKEMLHFITTLVVCCPNLEKVLIHRDFKEAVEEYLNDLSVDIYSTKNLDIEYWSYLTIDDYFKPTSAENLSQL